MKNCLKNTIGLKGLNFIELGTVLKEIQLILNNRLLCEPVDEDLFLTPNSVLFGRQLEKSNDQIRIDDISAEIPVKINKRFECLNTVIDYFWKKW